MSYAAFKMMHCPTGIENCASGFITHSAAELAVQVPLLHADDLESDWPVARRIGPVPNLVVTAGNVLEIYLVRVQEDDGRQPRAPSEAPRGGGVMEGISGARLELVCHYRLHGNVESMSVLSLGGDDCRRRDAIALAFKDSKISVVEYDDSIHGLRTSSMHCFEGPEWNHLKRGRESFCLGPLVKPDPQGRCAGVLVYGLQMIILKAAQIGQGIVGDDEANGPRGTFSISIESSYTINLRELDIKNVKDFTFVHVKRKTMEDPLCLEEEGSDDEWIAELQLCETEIDAYEELDTTVALEVDIIDLEQLVGVAGGIQVGESTRKRQKRKDKGKGKADIDVEEEDFQESDGDIEEDVEAEARMKYMDDS